MALLPVITKRSSSSVFRSTSPLASSASMVTALNSLSGDITELYDLYNNKLKPVLDGLAAGSDDEIIGLSSLNAIQIGLDGSVTFVERSSDSTDPEYIFSTTLNRPLTIKESLTHIHQSLLEQIESLSVNDALLDPIRDFIGQNSSEIHPIYSNHGSITTVNDGDTLEEAIQKLDEAIFDIVETPIDHSLLSNLTVGNPHTQYQLRSEKNIASGYAGLNLRTKVAPLYTDDIPKPFLTQHWQWSFSVRSGGVFQEAVGCEAPTQSASSVAANFQTNRLYKDFTQTGGGGTRAGLHQPSAFTNYQTFFPFTMYFVIKTGGDLTSSCFWMGETTATFADTNAGSTDHIAIRLRAGTDTLWTLSISKAGVQSTATFGSIVNVNSLYIIRMRYDLTNVYASVSTDNGGTFSTEASIVNTNVPATSVPLGPEVTRINQGAVTRTWSIGNVSWFSGSDY
jgi:hypothetical protein